MYQSNEQQGFITPKMVDTRTSKNGDVYTVLETEDGTYSDWNGGNYEPGVRYGIFYKINGQYRNITKSFVSKEQCAN